MTGRFESEVQSVTPCSLAMMPLILCITVTSTLSGCVYVGWSWDDVTLRSHINQSASALLSITIENHPAVLQMLPLATGTKPETNTIRCSYTRARSW
ncbi:uncharacterized protein BP01DRAFT_241376 [Aspergillus saccharolyticus JOP 1030-1]|uniref:Uncharacterized protein n=1 Tax=Aspergillus saccharolyticus JOP 1030-1 TaxID=1450539 RepID=A0A318ZHJ1_9EURO|nr:hypothetical protein BP01DRAFT_241376 [Aspergillus saccharolyticus JOP 1030-1]PYH46959.1 hypothetical protein BP01DRAFT_241376 [Aspergillus saccharolyticus JOP 1030-1]